MSELFVDPNEGQDAGYQVASVDVGTMQAIVQGEIDTQIRTAKSYPRDIKRSLTAARDLATVTQDVAGECYYRLERRAKGGGRNVIQGPSARFAEILATTWGNCRAGARIIEETDRFVVAQGAFVDLENNVAITYEVRRRITDREGRRYNDDMVGVTANAACSIALRNAVLKGIPKALWEPVLKEAIKTYRGDAQSLSERRANMLAAFAKLGVTEEQILRHLGKASAEAIGLDDIVALRGVFTALQEGDTTIEEAFPEPEPPEGAEGATKAEDVAQRMKKRRGRPRKTAAKKATKEEKAKAAAKDEPEPQPQPEPTPEAKKEPESAEDAERRQLLQEYKQEIDSAENEEVLAQYYRMVHESSTLSVEDKLLLDRAIADRRRKLRAGSQLFE